MNNKVAHNIAHVERLFMEVISIVEQESDNEKLLAYLNAESTNYKSIGFESASMQIAFQDLQKYGQLNRWNSLFDNKQNQHFFHIQIGLGWAIARAEIKSEDWNKFHLTENSNLIYDGIGYYNALYKRRRTVIGKLIPNTINEKMIGGFDQGLGRRLWYLAKGNLSIIHRSVTEFEISRRGNLWRGIGAACAYVSGLDKENLMLLSGEENEFRNSFRSGFAASSFSRLQSNTITENMKNDCALVCGFPFDEIMSSYFNMTENKNQPSNSWILEVEKGINYFNFDKIN